MAFTLWTFLVLLVSAVGFVLHWYLSPATDAVWLHVWIGLHAFVALTFLTVLPDRYKDAIINKFKHKDQDGQPSKDATAYAFRIYSMVLIVLSVFAVLVFRQGYVHEYTDPAYVVAPSTTLWLLWTVLEVLIERLKEDEIPTSTQTREETPLVGA